MNKNVIIFGAGASKHTGAPLLSEFRRKAEALFPDDSLFAKLNSLQMQAMSYKSNINLLNIEELFSLSEMGLILNKFPGCDDYNNIIEIKNQLKTIIVRTLEDSIKYPKLKETPYSPIPHFKNLDFIKKLKKLYSNDGDFYNNISLISFNYDISFDFALHHSNIDVDYHLENTLHANFDYLKLHGSLNWGYCAACNKVTPINIGKYFIDKIWSPHEINIDVPIHISKIVKNAPCNSCKQKKLETFIVPPSWNKLDYGLSLKNVWARASELLGQANSIFIVGYSLPKTDLFFKYLLALGIHGVSNLKKIVVYNPDISVENNYSNLFSTGMSTVYEFPANYDPLYGKYEAAIDHIINTIAELDKV